MPTFVSFPEHTSYFNSQLHKFDGAIRGCYGIDTEAATQARVPHENLASASSTWPRSPSLLCRTPSITILIRVVLRPAFDCVGSRIFFLFPREIDSPLHESSEFKCWNRASSIDSHPKQNIANNTRVTSRLDAREAVAMPWGNSIMHFEYEALRTLASRYKARK